MSEPAAPCERCPLEVTRAVASRGPVPAQLLLLSGAPRYHEEHDGVAFASPAFAWLEEALAAAGLDPVSVHYATLTGCRPPYQRPVRIEEIAACGPRLDLAVNAVAPRVIVLCGPDAVAAMLPGVVLSTGHGRLVVRGRRRYYPIRHPFAALHHQDYIDEVEADLHHLAELLAEGRLDSEAPLENVPPPTMMAAAAIAAVSEPAGAAPQNDAGAATSTLTHKLTPGPEFEDVAAPASLLDASAVAAGSGSGAGDDMPAGADDALPERQDMDGNPPQPEAALPPEPDATTAATATLEAVILETVTAPDDSDQDETDAPAQLSLF